MHYRLLFLVLIISIWNPIGAQTANRLKDITIIEQDETHLILRWQPKGLQYIKIESEEGDLTMPMMRYSIVEEHPGQPQLPYRLLPIGVPQGNRPVIQILNRQTDTKSSITLAPVPFVYKDKRGISENRYKIDPVLYEQSAAQSQPDVKLWEEEQLRQIAIRRVQINPFRYDFINRTLTVITSLTLRIDFPRAGASGMAEISSSTDKFENIYERALINYQQARAWKNPIRSSLPKPRAVGGFPALQLYSIAIDKEGIYKITPGILQDAGINISELSVGAIQLFNNGGRALSQKVSDTWYNPPYTSEIPIYLNDQNNNGLFDGSDYLLFYGKGSDGWFYDPASGNMTYQKNPYATQNNYLLTVQGQNGKRISEALLSDIPTASEVNYFFNRYHFEEDTYNLLASGPDWYGPRFLGLKDSYTKDFSLNYDPVTGIDPQFKIRFKGGAGVHWGDDNPYRYYFNIRMNNRLLVDNFSFTEHSLVTWTKTITTANVINNGSNTLNISYSAYKYEQSKAYLDWFEVYYTTLLKASDNYLRFFTQSGSADRRYSATDFNAASGIQAWDVTNPVDPVIIQKNLPGNQPIHLDIAGGGGEKEIIVFSPTSGLVQNVPKPIKVAAFQDLLDPANQADFLIITHSAFVPQANAIAQLRSSELKSKVITTGDIYYNFNNGTQDPTAIRNFIRYAYNNWQQPAPAFVLMFGDGHYDYRNIQITDSMRVPPFEIFDTQEINSRTTDNYYVDVNYNSDQNFRYISPDLAIGRIPVQSEKQAQDYLQKWLDYQLNPSRDGWQTVLTFVGDDQYTNRSNSEYIHQDQAEQMATLPQLAKFNIEKVYLSTFPTAPGGFGFVRPAANQALIDQINQGTLILNYVGHGSPTQWAHEEVLVMSRDLDRFNNQGKLPFVIAATCDFGKYDDPLEPSFSEKLIWRENSGAIGVLAATRLVYSGDNARFNEDYYENLFKSGQPSCRLGEAWLSAVFSGTNDQKYHLFADPTMYLDDPRGNIRIDSITPDTLAALSTVRFSAEILQNNQLAADYQGGAFLIVNDARFDSVITGQYFDPVTLPGPFIFKGEISVDDGQMQGSFIVPKSIRYENRPTGRATLFSWNEDGSQTAMGFTDNLLFIGSTSKNDREGPEIDLYFKDQENFSSGDLIASAPILVASLSDENGINITGEVGHRISVQLDDQPLKNITGFFSYDRDSYSAGKLRYPIDQLSAGEHVLKLTAFDNLNNPAEKEISFRISQGEGIVLSDVVNYPNPFSGSTRFTFQTNVDADVTIKIYTLTGRMIQELYGTSYRGYNGDIEWDGRDRDGDQIANGVYLYKLILNDGTQKKEQLEKLVLLR